ncbi:MAG: hypothetical protein V2J51_08405 [Erythrobacter sp.]|jgi:hypothetical protein|nr:hypothetical protein [Erythrobacter sp.]
MPTRRDTLLSSLAIAPTLAALARCNEILGGAQEIDYTVKTKPTNYTIPEEWQFVRPPNGAGGFVTSWQVDRHTGEIACGTDVYNGGFRLPGEDEWTMMFHTANLAQKRFDPLPERSHDVGLGLYGFSYAPSTAGVGYAAWHGDLFRFENRQPTQTAFADQPMRANSGASRRFQPVIAVHPQNDRIVAVGLSGGAVAYSTDGFDNWEWLDLPEAQKEHNGNPGKALVAWHTAETLLIHVRGHGMFTWRAGSDEAPVSVGGPLNSTGIRVLPSGDVWMCHHRFDAVSKETATQRAMRGIWRWRSGQWAQFKQGEDFDQIAVDPFDEQRMLAVDENSHKWLVSTDGPENFYSVGDDYRGAGETDWFSNQKKALYPARVDFHPLVRDRLVIAEGLGIAYAEFPGRISGMTVHDFSRGIHELVPTCGLSRPEQETILIGTMDKGRWEIDRTMRRVGTWTFAHKDNEPGPSAVTHLRSIDYAADDPDFVAGLFHQSSGVPGYSEDWGRTWKALPTKPSGESWKPGGCIAVSSRTDMLLCEGNNGGLWNIDIDAETVRPVGFGGLDQVDSQINAFYVQRKNIAACRERPGVFAMVCRTLDPHPELGGLWIRQADREWTQTVRGYVVEPEGNFFKHGQFWQARIEAVPGHRGEWLYARCEGKHRDPLGWIRSDGITVEKLPCYGLSSFSFGMGIGDRPSIFFYGYFEGKRGLYVTYDWFASDPILISRFPGGSVAPVTIGLGLVGDMSTVGRCAAGLAGNNWVFAEGV